MRGQGGGKEGWLEGGESEVGQKEEVNEDQGRLVTVSLTGLFYSITCGIELAVSFQ